MSIDSYLSAYLDRRMTTFISEWQIATRSDLADLNRRFYRAQDDLAGLKNFEKETEKKLEVLEERVSRLQELRR